MKEEWYMTLKDIPKIISEIYTELEHNNDPHILKISPGMKASTRFIIRFHAHLTWTRKELHKKGIDLTEAELKYKVLDHALIIEADGGDPYPFFTTKVKLEQPIGGQSTVEINVPDMATSKRSHRELITAYAALCYIAAQYEIILPEKLIDINTYM